MNIIVISRGIPSKREPQWGIFELDQAIALKEYGHNITVLSVDTRTRLIWRKIGVNKVQYCGVNCVNLFYPIPYFLLPQKISLYIIQKFILRLFDRHVKSNSFPDVIHAHYAFGIAYTALIKKKYPSIKLIGTEHWSVICKEFSKSAKLYTNIAYFIVDKMITVSKSLQEILLNKYNVKSVVINNMTDTDLFTYESKKKDYAEFHFVTVGSLIERKNINKLIEAFKLASFDCSIHLDIVGDGNQFKLLNSLIHNLNLEDQIHLRGCKSRLEIAKILQQSDAFVLSSKSETFGVVCIEALAAGLPVVSTICGGPEEYINDSNGILVPVDDVIALSKAMVQIKCNILNYDSHSISCNCKNMFSKFAIAQQLTNLYLEVL